jgi:hypothetical protein
VSRPRGTTPRQSLAIGLALVTVYAGACIVTLRLTGNDVRPLFEGVGPAAPYRRVDPPKEFEPGNIEPERSSTDVELRADGSQSAGLLSADSQLVLNVSKGAIPARPGETGVSFVFEPLDPAQLAGVDAPLRADGNAYRVDITYKPSDEPVGKLAAPADLLLITPEPGDAVLFSANGRSWTRLMSSKHEPGTGGVSATFTEAGYYLAATSRPPASAVGSSDEGYGTVLAIAVVAVLAIALVWTPFLLQRRRNRLTEGTRSRLAPPRKPQPRRRRRQ